MFSLRLYDFYSGSGSIHTGLGMWGISDQIKNVRTQLIKIRDYVEVSSTDSVLNNLFIKLYFMYAFAFQYAEKAVLWFHEQLIGRVHTMHGRRRLLDYFELKCIYFSTYGRSNVVFKIIKMERRNTSSYFI